MGLSHLHLVQQQRAAARRRRCSLGNIWGRAGSHTSLAPTRVPLVAPMPPECYIAGQKVTRPVNVVHWVSDQGAVLSARVRSSLLNGECGRW